MPVGCKWGHKEPLPTKAHPIFAQLRNERIRQNISMNDLSERMGYDRTTLSKWERGRGIPTALHFLDWCEALGVPVNLPCR